MTDRQRYVTADKLQADDEISPMPAMEGGTHERPRERTKERSSDVEDSSPPPPRPTTSE